MKFSLIALALALAWAPPALAATLRVNFSGVVDVLETDGEPGAPPSVGSVVELGTPFSGFFTFDDAAAPLESDEYLNLYAFAAPVFTLHTTLGEYEFGRQDWFQYGDQQVHEIRVQPSGSDDEGQVFGGYAAVNAPVRQLSSLPGGDQITDFYLELDGTGASGPVMSQEISDVPWLVDAFSVHKAGWFFIFVEDDFAHVTRVEGALTILGATPVPEPAPAVLAALGLAGLTTLGLGRARS